MPTYDYRCNNCGYEEEVFEKVSAPSTKVCVKCSSETFSRRPGGGIGLSFQGSGFYITDYGSKGSGQPEASPAAKQEGGGCCPCGKDKGACSS